LENQVSLKLYENRVAHSQGRAPKEITAILHFQESQVRSTKGACGAAGVGFLSIKS
jgi:hypothetical protein